MKLTKEDYMKLSKERLAELLVEMDNERPQNPLQNPPTYIPFTITNDPPCWSPNGWCSNPYHDCINCPKRGLTNGETYGTNTTTFTSHTASDNKTVEK